MVSLEFFIDVILPVAVWSWGWLSLQQMSTRNISWEVKVAGAYGGQPYHLQVQTVMKSGSLNLLEPSGPVQACNGIASKGGQCVGLTTLPPLCAYCNKIWEPQPPGNLRACPRLVQGLLLPPPGYNTSYTA
jgi:hypothetical protein